MSKFWSALVVVLVGSRPAALIGGGDLVLVAEGPDADDLAAEVLGPT